MSYCDDILKVAYRQCYSTMHCHCHVRAVTFHNILCQNNDIPGQTMSEQWHSRTYYVKTMTFQDKLCHRGDIPEQTMAEWWHSRTHYVKTMTFKDKLSQRWHSRTNYVRAVTFQNSVMTFLHTVLLMCWCTAFINRSLYSVFNCIDKAPRDSALLWGCRGSWVREPSKVQHPVILQLIIWTGFHSSDRKLFSRSQSNFTTNYGATIIESRGAADWLSTPWSIY